VFKFGRDGRIIVGIPEVPVGTMVLRSSQRRLSQLHLRREKMGKVGGFRAGFVFGMFGLL